MLCDFQGVAIFLVAFLINLIHILFFFCCHILFTWENWKQFMVFNYELHRIP